MAQAPITGRSVQKPEPGKRAVVAELEADPLDFSTFNAAQHRFFAGVRNPIPHSLTLVYFRKPNGLGGTAAIVAAWSAIMFGTDNPLLGGSPFGVMWPFKKSARLVAPGDLLGDKGALQTWMREFFPVARYKQSRGTGKNYYSEGETNSGWDWDVRTYDQTPQQCAGGNKGLVIFSEPPPQDIFTECCTRLRGNGMIFIDMTPLDQADWAEEMELRRALMLDGRKVGDVRFITGELEEACCDHYPPDPNDPTKPHGHRRHSEIQADIALWPWEEREARRTGHHLNRSGRIFPNWSDANELDALPDWHQRCWDEGWARVWCVANPHDRLAWPIFWGATFPNHDAVVFAEWPNFMWHECKSSPITHYEDMRWVIIEAEKGMPPVQDRVMDPKFGETIKQSGFNLFQKLRGPCLKCRPQGPVRETAWEQEAERLDTSCEHSLDFRHGVAYPGSVNAGHLLVRAAIGDQSLADPRKAIRPKLFAMKKACQNFTYMMRGYGWREKRRRREGVSTTPELFLKEPADCIRLAYLSHLDQYPQEAPLPSLWTPTQRGEGTTSIG